MDTRNKIKNVMGITLDDEADSQLLISENDVMDPPVILNDKQSTFTLEGSLSPTRSIEFMSKRRQKNRMCVN